MKRETDEPKSRLEPETWQKNEIANDGRWRDERGPQTP